MTGPTISDVHTPSTDWEKADSHVPPEAVRNNAKRGLEMREQYGRGGLDTQEAGEEGIGSGVARARDLSDGDGVSTDTLRRMVAFFNRHEGNKDTPPSEGNGQIAWLLWGGDAGRRWAESILNSMEKKGFDFSMPVVKIDDSKRLVYGWASVVSENGQAVVDRQGDLIDPDELVQAAHRFISESRTAMAMHDGPPRGEVVESMVLTTEVQKALGIDLGKVGWFIAMKIHDDEIWARAKAGELTAFSIGGKAKAEKIG
jgi:hypothetical protein